MSLTLYNVIYGYLFISHIGTYDTRLKQLLLNFKNDQHPMPSRLWNQPQSYNGAKLFPVKYDEKRNQQL
jgi:hypothetical protein